MALYAWGKLFHSNELSPLQSLCRSLSRGSIISLYWSLRRLTHLGSNLPGLQPTLHCDMQRRIWRSISLGVKAGRVKGVWPFCCNGLMEPSIYACRPIVFLRSLASFFGVAFLLGIFGKGLCRWLGRSVAMLLAAILRNEIVQGDVPGSRGYLIKP